jgi:hypothetical protein
VEFDRCPSKSEIDSKMVNLKNMYFATPSITEIVKKELHARKATLTILSDSDTDLLLSKSELPLNLTNHNNPKYEDNFKKLVESGKKDIKIVIINGLGGAIGDITIGSTALDIVDKKFRQYFKSIKYYVYNEHLEVCGKYLYPNIRINGVLPYPLPVIELTQFDAYIDLGAMIQWPEFNDRPMIDFYLDVMGVNSKTVPDYLKRLKLFYNLDFNSKASKFLDGFKLDKKLLLFNSVSTTALRSIPDRHVDRLLSELLQETDYHIVTFKDYPMKDERIINLSHISDSFLNYMIVVSKMDKIVTVDTSTYHLADSFNIPTVVLFTSIKSDYRIKYYSWCEGIQVNPEDSSVVGKHISTDKKELEKLSEYFESVSGKLIMEKFNQLENRRFDR